MLVLIMVLLYAMVIVLAYFFQEKMIFLPGKLPQEYVFDLREQDEEVFIAMEDGARINGLLFNNGAKKVVLYFHGNAGDLSGWQYVAQDFHTIGWDVLIIDYRGFGKSKGSLSEQAMYSDARACYDYLLQRQYAPEHIVIYGRSIGTGPAVDLAAQVTHGGLILETPYSSLSELAHEKMPFLFPKLISKYPFDSQSKLSGLSAPVFLVHGDRDGLIPYAHSQRLYEDIRVEKELLIVRGADHNNISSFPEYHDALRIFLENK